LFDESGIAGWRSELGDDGGADVLFERNPTDLASLRNLDAEYFGEIGRGNANGPRS
jgi:hypothetical protein